MVTFDICKGNPGALTFVMLAYEYNPYRAEAAFRRMQNNGITGDKLYMLWNDCCDRDVEQALVNMGVHEHGGDRVPHQLRRRTGHPHSEERKSVVAPLAVSEPDGR